jgi:hypothetical protein
MKEDRSCHQYYFLHPRERGHYRVPALLATVGKDFSPHTAKLGLIGSEYITPAWE